MVRALAAGVVLVPQDVAVHARRRIVAEIGEAGRVMEGREPDADHRAEQGAQNNPGPRPGISRHGGEWSIKSDTRELDLGCIVDSAAGGRVLLALLVLSSPFAFHIGFWNNLHHFLYVLGRAQDGTPDSQRPAVVRAPADVEGLDKQPRKARSAWEKSVRFYAEGPSKKDTVFDK